MLLRNRRLGERSSFLADLIVSACVGREWSLEVVSTFHSAAPAEPTSLDRDALLIKLFHRC